MALFCYVISISSRKFAFSNFRNTLLKNHSNFDVPMQALLVFFVLYKKVNIKDLCMIL